MLWLYIIAAIIAAVVIARLVISWRDYLGIRKLLRGKRIWIDPEAAKYLASKPESDELARALAKYGAMLVSREEAGIHVGVVEDGDGAYIYVHDPVADKVGREMSVYDDMTRIVDLIADSIWVWQRKDAKAQETQPIA